MKSTFYFIFLLLLVSCADSTPSEIGDKKKKYVNTIEQKIVNFEGYEKAVHQNDDVLYVVNFWATWCVPCVKELPHFIEVNEKYKDQRFNMTFVTLDQAKNFESRVLPFVAEKNMNADLLLLDDVKNMNTWIKKVHPKWSGAIPATIFYKNGETLHFTEGELTETELENLINKYI